jgi:ribose transport system permease protein
MTETQREIGGLVAHVRARVAHRNFETVGLFLGLALLVSFFSAKSPVFLTRPNFIAIGLAISLTGILAAVQTIMIVSGSIDLSFMAILALSGIAAQKTFAAGAPFSVILVTGLLVGAAGGLVNAHIVVGAGVNPLIATIGTTFAIRGMCFLWLGNTNLPYFEHTAFNYLGDGRILGVPFPVLLTVAVIGAVWASMKFTRFGARVYAAGGSATATRLAGISIPRLRTLVFVLSGLSAGLGGLLLTSLNGSAFADAGQGDELKVIAAVILGGTALTGGRGSVIGTTLGVLLLGVLANGLNLLGVNPYWQVVLSGTILVLAVVVDEVRKRAAER